MWRSPWILISSFSLVLFSLSLALFLPGASHFAGAPAWTSAWFSGTALAAGPESSLPATSSGPTSPEEGRILWQDGKEAFDAGHYPDAIPLLERLIARYPGYPGYLEAHLLLGRALMRQGEAEKAKPYFKDYIQATGHSPLSLVARLDLARADLALKHFPEALFLTEEVLKTRRPKNPKAPLPREVITAEALTLKAQALIGLNHDIRAKSALDSAKKSFPEKSSIPLQGEALTTELQLKFRDCAKFPGPGHLDEAQVRDQLDRRGTCLHESLLLFRQALTLADPEISAAAEAGVSTAYQAYRHSCAHPPSPPPTHPKDRTAQQLESYFRETAVVLDEDCRQKIKQARELLNGWSAAVPAPASPSLKKVQATLDQLMTTPPGDPHT